MKAARESVVLSFYNSGRVQSMWLTVLALSLLWILAACESQTPAVPKLRAENVWSRPAMAMGHEMGVTGVVYMTLVNEGRGADRLIGAQTDVGTTAELHQTTMEGAVMKMKPVSNGIEIPAGGQVELKPGGYHMMLINLRRNLKLGDRFAVTLKFEKSGTMTVEAEVRF